MKHFLTTLFLICCMLGICSQAMAGVSGQEEKIYLSTDQVSFCENALIAF